PNRSDDEGGDLDPLAVGLGAMFDSRLIEVRIEPPSETELLHLSEGVGKPLHLLDAQESLTLLRLVSGRGVPNRIEAFRHKANLARDRISLARVRAASGVILFEISILSLRFATFRPAAPGRYSTIHVFRPDGITLTPKPVKSSSKVMYGRAPG